MTTTQAGVTCAHHGESHGAVLCEHLIARPKQRWFCDPPSKRDPWPAAACADCNRRFLRKGTWTRGIVAHLKLVCHHCYDDKRSTASTYLDAACRPAWQRCLAHARAALKARQDRLVKAFALGEHKRWDWDQDTGRIVFSNDGVPAVEARVHFVGSTSAVSGTWLWAWANPHLARKVRDASKRVRAFGEAHGFARLTIPKWKGEQPDGWDMAAIAAEVLRADGVYRTPRDDGGALFMVLKATRHVDDLPQAERALARRHR